MNKSVISVFLGRMLIITSVLLLLPLFVALIYSEALHIKISYLSSAVLAAGLGLALISFKKESSKFHTKEGLVACALTWLLMSLVGALPIFLTGEIPNYIDAFFEISSGFTTTGASILNNVEALSKANLFWRSFTHFVGGMGVLVFAFIILSKVEADGVFLLKAEMTGPSFGKITSSLKNTSRILYGIYLGMTAALTLALVLAGMPLFDALCHAFGTAGTGGFSTKNTSVAWFHSPAIEWILAIGMVAFGVNFNLYYLLLLRKFKSFFSDEELRWYIGIVLVAVGLVVYNLRNIIPPEGGLIRTSFFNVASLMSTTGFGTVDFSYWPALSQFVLLLVTFLGGMAGSTAGGFKIARVLLCLKTAEAELKRQREPGRTVPVILNAKPVQQAAYRPLFGYISMYLILFVALLFAISFEVNDFGTAFSASTAILNNIGPGLNAVGPSGNYSFFSPLTKIIMSFAMIAGRLEVWPVVILFSRKTWRKA